MPRTYRFVREQTCTVIAPDAKTAHALAADTVWVNQGRVMVAQVLDEDGRDVTPLPFGGVTPEEDDAGWDDPWHDHQAHEVAVLAAEEREATWVGEAA